VDNNGDGSQTCGEPSKGIVNRLWAKIHNLGTTTASNVSVTFYYAPYNAGYPHTHFKLIGTPPPITIAGSGGVGYVEVPWDLSNLLEDNGGLWPLPISGFNHFCVRVEITCAGDTNPANNSAQNNFTEVPCSECGFNFIIANPKNRHVSASLITSELPKGWTMNITAKGVKNIQEFTLAPNESKLARLALSHPKKQHGLGENIDVSLKLDGQLVGGITFRPVKTPPRKSRSLSFHVGRAIPIVSYSKMYNSGCSLITDIDFHFNSFSLVFLFGYNMFQAGVPTGNDTHWWNLSLNLKKEFMVSSTINIYLKAGPGAYIPKSGSVEAGFNAGLGWNYSLAQDCRLEFGSDYHKILGSTKVDFIVTHVGVIFRY
jgi:hypothetical protein